MTISAESLQPNVTVIVRGKTTFSRIASLIQGKELEKRVSNSKSLYPTREPHTSISVSEPQIVSLGGDAGLTREEQHVQERFYTSKSGANQGKAMFGIDNKSPYLPTVLAPDEENPGSHTQVVLERDLDAGLDVTLVLKTFAPKGGYQKKGIGLQQVILNEPLRYYSQGIDESALSAIGVTVAGPLTQVSANDAPATAVPPTQGEDQLPENTVVDQESGLPMPGFTPAPQQAQQTPQPAQVDPAVQQAQQAQQPAQAPAAAAAPSAQQGPSNEDEIAQLKAKIAAMENSGGNSAFDTGDQGQGDGPAPWDVSPDQGNVYNG